MDNCWDILQIKRTKDVKSIKEAYRAKLVQVHPEDDPEGFMRLRKAYEEALNEAKGKKINGILIFPVPQLNKEEQPPKGKSPWERVEEFYLDYFKRVTVSGWENLFLQFSIEEFMVFSAQAGVFFNAHAALPYPVWQWLEEKLALCEQPEFALHQFVRFDYGFRFLETGWKDHETVARYAEVRMEAFDALNDRKNALALSLVEKAENLCLPDASLLKIKGLALMRSGKADDAAAVFSHALKHSLNEEEEQDIRLLRSKSFLASGEPKKARADVEDEKQNGGSVLKLLTGCKSAALVMAACGEGFSAIKLRNDITKTFKRNDLELDAMENLARNGTLKSAAGIWLTGERLLLVAKCLLLLIVSVVLILALHMAGALLAIGLIKGVVSWTEEKQVRKR